MPLIWRGMGIAVPIVFFLSGLLVSWLSGDPDARIGNPNFIGWTSLWSGIVLTLLGLAALGMSEGEDANGNKVKKKHDFFFVPIVVWGLILGGLSLYLLVFSGKAASTPPSDLPSGLIEEALPPEEVVPTTRIVNFFNPTKDTMSFVIMDETAEGLIERANVPPMSFVTRELEENDYYFSGYDSKKKWTLSLPSEADASDTTKYIRYEDDKGPFHQRIVGKRTKENDDYDEAWLVLDGKTKLMLVNASTACDPRVTEADVKKGDWAGSIQEEYEPTDMIEPLYKMFLKGKQIKVVAPGQKLPTDIAENDVVYLLVPYSGKVDKNALIVKAVIAARF